MHLIVYDDTFFYRQILSSGDSDLNTLTFIDVKSCTIASFNSFNSRCICKSKLRLINHLYCKMPKMEITLSASNLVYRLQTLIISIQN